MDNNFKNSTKRDVTPINNQIRAQKVLCIDHEGSNLGLIDTFKALEIARNNELDLVQISYNAKDNVTTCKILDYGKYKFQISKNVKAAAKKQRESEIKLKEIKLRPTTEFNDLKIKAAKAQEILADGDKVKISIVFKGRELNYRENGYETYKTFTDLIGNFQIVESLSLNGRVLSSIIIRDMRILHIDENLKKLKYKLEKDNLIFNNPSNSEDALAAVAITKEQLETGIDQHITDVINCKKS